MDEKYKLKNENKKILVIFDFDYTMIDVDSVYEVARLGLNQEEVDKIKEYDLTLSFRYAINYLYKTLKNFGKSIKDLNSYYDKIKINQNMLNLLNYFHENNDKYDLIIISGNADYPIKKILNNHSMINYFKDIISMKTEFSEENLLYLLPEIKTNCKNCNPNTCKTYLYKEYIRKKNDNGINYKKYYYICDGGNDYCLSQNLNENDCIFVKKDFGLYKKLYNKGLIKNIKSKIILWNSGEDILKEIKNN